MNNYIIKSSDEKTEPCYILENPQIKLAQDMYSYFNKASNLSQQFL